MRTIDRYVIREILPPMLLALLIFTFLLTLPPFMDHLENLLARFLLQNLRRVRLRS